MKSTLVQASRILIVAQLPSGLYPENHMKGMIVNLDTVRLPYHELGLSRVPERRSLDQGASLSRHDQYPRRGYPLRGAVRCGLPARSVQRSSTGRC